MVEFISLRPMYIFLIIVLVVSLVILIFQKKDLKVINGFTVIIIGLICSGASAISLYMSGYIVDEFGLGGDAISTYMVIGIGILSIINLYIYSRKFYDNEDEK